jgi:hypothetical protein
MWSLVDVEFVSIPVRYRFIKAKFPILGDLKTFNERLPIFI